MNVLDRIRERFDDAKRYNEKRKETGGSGTQQMEDRKPGLQPPEEVAGGYRACMQFS